MFFPLPFTRFQCICSYGTSWENGPYFWVCVPTLNSMGYCTSKILSSRISGLNRLVITRIASQAWNREGAQLCISIQKDRFRSTIESLTSNWTRKPLIVTADVNQDEGLDSAFETIGREFDNIDCMSHSIAYATQSGMKNSILDCTREDFSIAHETSAYSLIALAKRVVPHMHSGGSIISLSYIGSQRAASTYRVMGPAKASLEATSRYLAQELGPKNIRVNVISAGPINTLAARGIVGFTVSDAVE